MLPAAARLRRRAEFTATVRGGSRSSTAALVVHLRIPPPSASEPASTAAARAGFVVSRAVGGAVVRNRVRRRLRHLTRPHLAGLPAGSTLVVRATAAAAEARSAELGRQLDGGLRAALARAGR